MGLTFHYIPPSGDPYDEQVHTLSAAENGKHAGYMELAHNPDELHEHGKILNVELDKNFRGRGIAKAMGQHFQDVIGITPRHSNERTPEGDAFARSNPQWALPENTNPKPSYYAMMHEAVRWEDEGHRGDQLTFEHIPSREDPHTGYISNHIVNAQINGQHVGQMEVAGGDPETFKNYPQVTHGLQPGEIAGVEITDTKHLGRGIARAMGEHLMSKGIQPRHSHDLTPEGRGFAQSTPEWGQVTAATWNPKTLPINFEFMHADDLGSEQHEIIARHGKTGDQIGKMSLDAGYGHEPAGLINMVQVGPETKYRGRGVARAMGEFAIQNGVQPIHSDIKTRDGHGFAGATPEWPSYSRGKVYPGKAPKIKRGQDPEQLGMFG